MTSPPGIRFDAVADLYDAYVQADFDVPFWLEEARAVRGKVLELTSGTGRVSLPLLRAGIDLTCVDYSAGMIAVLRQKLHQENLDCPVYLMDIAELALPDRYELAFIPFHALSESTEREKQETILRHIRMHLAPEGRFICSLQNGPVRACSMDGSVVRLGEFPLGLGGKLLVSTQLTYDPASQIASGAQMYEEYDRHGKLHAKRSLGVRFYLFGREEFQNLACRTGFQVEALYGDYHRGVFEDEKSPFMIWKLRR